MILNNAEIVKKLEGMDQEAKQLRKRLIEYCWYMRGGITFSELVQMPVSDISLINEVVESNLETAKKSGQPFF